MALLAMALVCAAASAGCATPPHPAAAFAISYERSGGLKPMPQKLTIRPGRHAVATVTGTNGRPRSTHFRVPARKVESLRRALARANFESIRTAGPVPDICADCYLYAIAYRGHEVSFDQVTVPRPLRGVVGQLEALVEAHRPFH